MCVRGVRGVCLCVGLAVAVRGVPVGGGVRVTHRLPLRRHLACNQGEVSGGNAIMAMMAMMAVMAMALMLS